MGNEGRPIRVGDPVAAEPPGITDLLDPVALEERLKEARTRRAAALAGRAPAPGARAGFAEAAAPFAAAPTPTAPETTVETTVEAVPIRPARVPGVTAAPAQPDADPAPFARAVRVPVWAIFVTGLALGAAVVALFARSPAPTTPAPPVVAAAPDPAIPDPPAPAAAEPAPVATPPTPAPLATAETPPEPPRDGIAEPAAATVAPTIPAPSKPAKPAPETAPPSDIATAEPAATIAPPVPPEPPAEPPAAPAAAIADAAPPLPARVIINYPPSAAAEADRARATLLDAGIANVGTVAVRFDISRSNVRFYHEGDGPAATTVATLLAGEGEAPTARDFTDYATPAAAGVLEVWLAGDSGRGSTPPTRPRRPPAATTPAPAPASAPAPQADGSPLPVAGTFFPDPGAPLPVPTAGPDPAGPQDQAQAVARIIVERAYERLSRIVPGR